MGTSIETRDKRDATLKNKLLALIRQFPGTKAANVPVSQKRFLRPLEKDGVIEYRDGGWFIRPPILGFRH